MQRLAFPKEPAIPLEALARLAISWLVVSPSELNDPIRSQSRRLSPVEPWSRATEVESWHREDGIDSSPWSSIIGAVPPC